MGVFFLAEDIFGFFSHFQLISAMFVFTEDSLLFGYILFSCLRVRTMLMKMIFIIFKGRIFFMVLIVLINTIMAVNAVIPVLMNVVAAVKLPRFLYQRFSFSEVKST